MLNYKDSDITLKEFGQVKICSRYDLAMKLHHDIDSNIAQFFLALFSGGLSKMSSMWSSLFLWNAFSLLLKNFKHIKKTKTNPKKRKTQSKPQLERSKKNEKKKLQSKPQLEKNKKKQRKNKKKTKANYLFSLVFRFFFALFLFFFALFLFFFVRLCFRIFFVFFLSQVTWWPGPSKM